jgi:hypothetical protein
MNIEQSKRTRKQLYILLFIFLLFTILPAVKAQVTDTIVPVNEDPEKLLKRLKIGKLEDGFNFWQDNFSGHWAGVDFGFNAFLNDDYTGYENEFMDVDVFRSNSTYINLVQQSVGLQHNRNTFGLVTGLGLHLQSYRLSKNTTIERLPNGRIVPNTLVFNDNQKSKFSIASIYVPLLAEFQVPVNHYENRLYISGGLYTSYTLSSHTKIKYREERKEKLKVPDHFSLHSFKYGIMIRSGYRWVNVFATYELIPLFKKDLGPRLTPFTFGITLLQF